MSTRTTTLAESQSFPMTELRRTSLQRHGSIISSLGVGTGEVAVITTKPQLRHGRRDRGGCEDGDARLLRSKRLWLLSTLYSFGLGADFTAGGWVVEFPDHGALGSLAAAGYVPTRFHGGMLAGRLMLAEPAFRFGEQRMLLVYSALCVALQLVFWLQPNIIGSAKSTIVPPGFIFVLAQAGGALFPSITGAIASDAGVAVLQPIVLALFIVGGISWWLVPQVPRRNEGHRCTHILSSLLSYDL
ncbi:hypothetical protein F4804DRAFT_338131 [Jackrogersella minutella]|nr:hypothetical protein F4804DRAFT_338131 [Jackrogersella minutella]